MHNKPQKEYPYQNLSLNNIEGECWEDIPGLDGYVLISNFGRIKRQQYEMQTSNALNYLMPEKIIKPKFGKAVNKFKNDYTYYLIGKVVIEGKCYAFSTARMVYYCFIEPFDFDDTNIVILFKDFDNLNIHPSNLILGTRDQKAQRAVKRQRFRSSFFDLTDEKKGTIRKSIVETLSKPVTQFTVKGEKIETYKSASEASRVTGVLAKCIGEAASGLSITAGNYLWRWGNEEKLDVEGFREDKRKRKRGQKVTQYDLSGKKIYQYQSVQAAAEATGADVTNINMVLRGKYKSSKGFFWKKGYGEDFINI